MGTEALLLANDPPRQLLNMRPARPGQLAASHDPSPLTSVLPFDGLFEWFDVDVAAKADRRSSRTGISGVTRTQDMGGGR